MVESLREGSDGRVATRARDDRGYRLVHLGTVPIGQDLQRFEIDNIILVYGNRPQIAAQNEVDAIKAWLARFVDTKATFDTYRKESERLLLLSTTELRKPLSSLTHEDLLLYRRFLADPQPAQRRVMTGRKVARADPHWRPFAGLLSPSSARQAFVILNTLFAWLVNAGYLAGNPLSLSRQRARKTKPRVTRFLEDDLWQAVKTSIDAMPRVTAREQEHYARVRWLISLLYLMGLRISEVVSNPMGAFLDGAMAKGRTDGG